MKGEDANRRSGWDGGGQGKGSTRDRVLEPMLLSPPPPPWSILSVYVDAFAIYGLTEFYLATRKPEAAQLALKVSRGK
jgi:hypothetical protein